MAEAFTLVSLAANLAQFIEYGIRLVSESHKVYHSIEGAKDENVELQQVIEDFTSLNKTLAPAALKSGPHALAASDHEAALHGLAKSCEPIAKELLDLLESLKVKDGCRFRRWESLRKALRSAARKGEIEQLEKRLSRIQAQLGRRQVVILSQQNAAILAWVRRIEEWNKRVETDTSSDLSRLRTDILNCLNTEGLNGSTIETTITDLFDRLSILANEAKVVERKEKLLESLCFKSLKMRFSDIKIAHRETLEWLFRHEKIMFRDWLETQNGIYWISGKAGSGKSTLMKYICNHTKTLEALQTWAGPTRLVTANYFFWNSGYPMQKSQQGLFQTLLYQILQQCPDLIQTVCSERWESTDGRLSEPWSLTELAKVLFRVKDQHTLDTKFCFFIDGLDEYDGDGLDIIEILTDLATSSCIKLCVSSRPWNVFVHAFEGAEWKLKLQDLTKDDMNIYIEEMLTRNRLFEMLRATDDRCATLATQISGKAQGVWLWVYLVVRSLLRGLTNDDGFELLQQRLDEFPEDLEDYFRHILSKVEKIYQEEMAQLFLVTVEALDPLPVMALHFFALEKKGFDSTSNREIQPISSMDAHHICDTWRKRLNSRCKDLLEINVDIASRSSYLQQRVTFLHRTVKDFLANKSMQDELQKWSGETFDANVSICRMLVGLTKTSIADGVHALDPSMILDISTIVIYHARQLELHKRPLYIATLDELNQVFTSRTFKEHNGGSRYWTIGKDFLTDQDSNELGEHIILILAIIARLTQYVTHRLSIHSESLHNRCGRSLLDYALCPTIVSGTHLEHNALLSDLDTDLDLLSVLLANGWNPNEESFHNTNLPSNLVQCRSPWQRFLLCFMRLPRTRQDINYQAVEMLLHHGASPDDLRRTFRPAIKAEEGGAWKDQDAVTTEILHRLFPPRQVWENYFLPCDLHSPSVDLVLCGAGFNVSSHPITLFL